ncbi:recombinase family protein [Vibrio fluminensis]|uniref:recombinase family protein n=1 Tax=Vibrio fluminensis TaxID=2783614 RepID=UPI001888B5BC|nr:recombinase family protein [Vibrio fluminensis]
MLIASAKPQVYSYRRFSNIEQEHGRSIARQDKFALKVAKEHGLEINQDLVMTDKGFSAFHAQHKSRGAFGVFLKLVEESYVAAGSILLVESLDRLSRESPMIAQSTLSALVQSDITVITTLDKRVYNKQTFAQDPLGTMILSILEMVRAHNESLVKQQRSIDFIQAEIAKFNSGEVADVAGSIPFWIERKVSMEACSKTKFRLNDQADVALLIVDLYLNQSLGLREISKELHRRSIKAPKGGSMWGVSTISTILDNAALCGRKEFVLKYLSDGNEETEKYCLENYYPALITKDQYDAIRAIKKRKHSAMRGDKSIRGGGMVYLLTDYGKKSVCGKCQRSIGSQPQRQKNRIRRRLHCSTHKETANCCKSIIQDYLEDAFLVSVSRHIDYGLIDTEQLEKQKITVEEQIAEIDVQIRNVLDTLTIITDSNVRTRQKAEYKKLEEEKEQLASKIEEVETYDISADAVKEFIHKVNAARNYENHEERRFIKDILVKAIRKLDVHMEAKNLSDYGYSNIFGNDRVHVIDVDFYSNRQLSIFVSATSNQLLFTRICDEFSNDARGSFTEQQLQNWNKYGYEALMEICKTDIIDGVNAPENLWFASDFAEFMTTAIAEHMESNE